MAMPNYLRGRSSWRTTWTGSPCLRGAPKGSHRPRGPSLATGIGLS